MDAQSVAAFRARMGWTRKALAERMGVSAETVQAWELGERTPSSGAIMHMLEIEEVEKMKANRKGPLVESNPGVRPYFAGKRKPPNSRAKRGGSR